MAVPVTFVTACAASDTMLMVATIPDQISGDAEFTRLFYLNLELDELWQHVDLPDHQVVSVCLRRAIAGRRPRAGCAMTADGRIEIANSQETHYEHIVEAGLDGTRGLGDLTRIKEIGSLLFACGGIGQVYRRDEAGWVAIDDEIVTLGRGLLEGSGGGGPDPLSDIRQLAERLRMLPNFNDMDGTDENDFYVCGIGGNLYHYQGEWRKVESGTGNILTSIHSVSPDETWIAGQDGIVIRGNARDGFQTVGTFFPESYIWSIRKFRGEVYLGALHGLYRLAGDRAVLVEGEGLTDATPIIAVDSFSDNAMWIASNRHAFRHDGTGISYYRHGDNV